MSKLDERPRVAVLGAPRDPLRVALEQRLRDDSRVQVIAHPLDLELALEQAAVVICPLLAEPAASQTVRRACERGCSAGVIGYGDGASAAAVVDALRSGVIDVLSSADLPLAGARVLESLAASRARGATRTAQVELERYRRFFEAGPVIIFRWRAAEGWPVEAVSPNVAPLFGVSAEDFLSGRASYAASVHADDLERVAREVASYSEAGERTFDQEYRIVRPDGEVRWLYDHTVVTRDPQGIVTHYEGYVFDVTQLERERRTRAQAERELYQAQKLESLGLLAGGVAHDFNNLLTTILGESALTLTMLPPGSPEHASLSNVIAAARSAAGLTRQMLAYAGRASSTPQACDVRALVGEVAHLMERGLPKNVRLELRLGDAPSNVSADPAQIQQVAMNLVINAAEACAESGGTVLLELSAVRANLSGAQCECVRMDVVDNGCGMDAATLARIFEPFFSTKFSGRGLGLSAVQGIVRSHGGELLVTSELGRGTRARVLLPASSAPAHPPAPLPAPAGASGERILIVDDEDAVARVAARCLERCGYSTTIVSSGARALAELDSARGAIAGVLLDRTMPGMSGEETLAAIRVRFPQLSVVLTSGFDESESLLATRRARPDAFLRKPFTPDELARAIRVALDRARAVRRG